MRIDPRVGSGHGLLLAGALALLPWKAAQADVYDDLREQAKAFAQERWNQATSEIGPPPALPDPAAGEPRGAQGPLRSKLLPADDRPANEARHDADELEPSPPGDRDNR